VSVRVMSIVWEIALPDSEKIVLLALADCANDEGDCWPSMATLARKCSKTDRTIQSAIKALVAAGHLTRRENPGKGCNYTVHPVRGTPEATSPRKDYPPKGTAQTPEATSDKPSKNHHIPSEAKASSGKRGRATDEFPCPDGVDPIDWQSLLANRKHLRVPMTAGAYRQIVNKLERWCREGWPPGPIVAHAVERGWRTVFETDEMKRTPHGKPVHFRPAKQSSRAARLLDAIRAEQSEPEGFAFDPGAGRSLPAISGHQ